jgi:hypothetical protein
MRVMIDCRQMVLIPILPSSLWQQPLPPMRELPTARSTGHVLSRCGRSVPGDGKRSSMQPWEISRGAVSPILGTYFSSSDRMRPSKNASVAGSSCSSRARPRRPNPSKHGLRAVPVAWRPIDWRSDGCGAGAHLEGPEDPWLLLGRNSPGGRDDQNVEG